MHHTAKLERKILELADVKSANLLKYRNVHGFYPGKKRVGGVETDENCVVVLVTNKISKQELRDEDIIPQNIGKGVKTDVVQLPSMIINGYCGGSNPIPPDKRRKSGCPDHIYDNETLEPYTDIPGGISIGNAGILDAGTMGMLVRDRDSRKIVGLTANHAVGLQPYYVGNHHQPIEYILTDNNFTFVMNNSDKTRSIVEGKFDDVDFPKLIAGNLYKFTNESFLHDMYISTNETKNNGGGSLNPYLNITIYDKQGEIRYSGGQGTGTPAISAGETMYLTADSQLTQSELHYGSWVYPNIGAPIQLMFMGVPPCRSTNRTQPGGGEYYDGLLSSKYKNLRGNRLGHPGNLDAGVGGSGQIVIGGVDKIEPIKFCHPRNTTQPINKIDACTVDLDTTIIQGKTGVLNLNTIPLVASQTWVGAEVFKSGRTTGVTPSGAHVMADGTLGGNTNKCKIMSTTATISINYCLDHPGTVQGTAIFEDVLLYELNNEWFSAAGDSGSAILMKDDTDGNKTKLVGVHIAGGYDDSDGDEIADTPIRSFGIGSRIQNVFETLNLTNWEGTIILPFDDPCVKLDGLCYTRDAQSYLVPPTHLRVDERFDDCSKCTND